MWFFPLIVGALILGIVGSIFGMGAFGYPVILLALAGAAAKLVTTARATPKERREEMASQDGAGKTHVATGVAHAGQEHMTPEQMAPEHRTARR